MNLLESLGIRGLPDQRSMFEHYADLDRKLVAKNWPATSPWWLNVFAKVFNPQTFKRQWVLRVGRRGGKSSSLCRLAVVVALHGQHQIPPGDIGIVGVVSISKSDAKKRLRTIKQILDVLGEKYKPLSEGDGVELLSKPVAFQVLAAQIGSVVGGTWICGICDEVAHWRDKDTGVNPANEVLASMRPTMATMPRAQMFLSSSVLGLEDAHAKAFAEGDTPRQSIASAPTWIANPTLTEEQTKLDEPSERVWAREYANRPQAAVSAVFDVDHLAKAFKQRPIENAAQSILVIDASRGGDAFAYGVLRWVWSEGKARLQLVSNGETPPVDKSSEDFTDIAIKYLCALCKEQNIYQVCADQYEAGSLGLHFKNAGLTFWEHVWTNGTKKAAVDTLERLMRDGELVLCRSEKLDKQLRQYRERITRNNELVYGGSGAHDDYVQVLMTAVMADSENRLQRADAPVNEPARGTDEWHRKEEQRIEDLYSARLRDQQSEDQEPWEY